MRSLNEIGLAQVTDKASNIHDYLHFYDRRLAHLRAEAFVLIEIGVFKGGSCRSWGEYFPNAQIVGLDVDPSCKNYEAGNIAIRIGDACDTGFLFSVIEEFGRPTVAIDDGSHRWDHQIMALQTLFPLVKPGGYFIMEDLDTSFSEHLKQARFEGVSSVSAFDYLSLLAARVVAHNAFGDVKPYDLFTHNHHEDVGSVEFGRRTCVISKKLDRTSGPICTQPRGSQWTAPGVRRSREMPTGTGSIRTTSCRKGARKASSG